ncbi:hypothetical protein A2714_00275 [Candidatus Woesebacteria bacterium RIFCSPHIGHO2_01_FULL_38_9]|uniref:Uncharacterized protein n=2 Tax=Candidatus Woeseibacteriota TaxID=1752722 RepID=A0A1F7Y3Q5_9BACT|nr:MAG: hypothetical protein A2714_00275 [Candidatus Woesebacteria bacterium RIFCSPHIGHO2_01_FULL_38_9]OGM58240.1 MAG: hypothetical protein A3A75_04340 [Candidatus Woesebacteria bacterium RIFCSPLOWO2_01_FULL_39_10]
MGEKVLGYILIALGVIVMLLATFSVYQVFTNKSQPVNIFNLPGISIDMSDLVGSDLSPEEIAQLREQKSLKTDLISPEIINKPLNLIAHILFMGFILNVGFKVAALGVGLVRPINVKLGKVGEVSTTLTPKA